jgi:Tol biopolymer transport system component
MRFLPLFAILVLCGSAISSYSQVPSLPKDGLVRPSSTAVLDGDAASGDSGAAVFTADARFAFFLSDAGNLVSNKWGNGFASVFRQDLRLGTVVRVSDGGDDGGSANGPATAFSVSTNGRWLAFTSRAANLVSGDSNAAEDVFFRDLESGSIRLVSKSRSGMTGNAESFNPLISGDGRWILFESAASNLPSIPDTNRVYNVLVWDRDRDSMTLVSVGLQGLLANGSSNAEWVSHDGEKVVFRSAATNLVSTSTGIETDLYVWSRTLREVKRIGLPGQRPSDLAAPVATYNPVIGGEGRYLSFRTLGMRTALNGVDGIWLVDLSEGTTAFRISGAGFSGRPVGIADRSGPVISADSQRIAFEMRAFSNEPPKVRIWSHSDGLRSLDEVVSGAQPSFPEPSSSWSPVLSSDGALMAFETDAAVPAAGVVLPGTSRFYVRVLATGETRTLFPGYTFESPLPAPVFSPDGSSLMFQTAAVLPGISDLNRAGDVFIAPASLDRVQLVSRRHPDLLSATGAGSSALGVGSLSDDGRWLVFTSASDNLVSNDSNGRMDVFVRDLIVGTNHLVSVSVDGKAPAADSWQPRISSDGKRVVFVSMATNLVRDVQPQRRAVYVRDLPSRSTVLASAKDGSEEGASLAAFNPQISADGERVIFESMADNLAEGVWGRTFEVKLFVRTLVSRRTQLISDSLSNAFQIGREGKLGLFSATLDAQGSKVVFLVLSDPYEYLVSEGIPRRISAGIRATSLSLSRDGNRLAMSGTETNGTGVTPYMVYWRDLLAGTNQIIAVTSNGLPNLFENVSISADGGVVAFDWNFGPSGLSDTNGTSDVFTFDIAAGRLSRVSSAIGGVEAGNGASDAPMLSFDGRRVVFRSLASDLVADDTNKVADVFVQNRVTGEVTRSSQRLFVGLSGSDRASSPLVSGDGSVVVFRSRAADLAPGDYNSVSDVFASVFPPPAPALVAPLLVAGDRFQFEIQGVAGTQVLVQFSEDLFRWVTHSSHTLPDSLEIPLFPGTLSGFYRAVIEE